jgi:hypothetical protein
MTIFKIKDPDARLDYVINWTTWLEGDTLNAVSWVVPTGITEGVGTYASTFDGQTSTIWLSGGTLHSKYDITCRITTSLGRIDDYTFTVVCEPT